jgi:hypothetical protein
MLTTFSTGMCCQRLRAALKQLTEVHFRVPGLKRYPCVGLAFFSALLESVSIIRVVPRNQDFRPCGAGSLFIFIYLYFRRHVWNKSLIH